MSPPLREAKTPPTRNVLRGLPLMLIGAPGFEPGTSCSQSTARACKMRARPTHPAARPYGFPKVSHPERASCIRVAGFVTHDARTNVSSPR